MSTKKVDTCGRVSTIRLRHFGGVRCAISKKYNADDVSVSSIACAKLRLEWKARGVDRVIDLLSAFGAYIAVRGVPSGGVRADKR